MVFIAAAAGRGAFLEQRRGQRGESGPGGGIGAGAGGDDQRGVDDRQGVLLGDEHGQAVAEREADRRRQCDRWQRRGLWWRGAERLVGHRPARRLAALLADGPAWHVGDDPLTRYALDDDPGRVRQLVADDTGKVLRRDGVVAGKVRRQIARIVPELVVAVEVLGNTAQPFEPGHGVGVDRGAGTLELGLLDAAAAQPIEFRVDCLFECRRRDATPGRRLDREHRAELQVLDPGRDILGELTVADEELVEA